jgi:peptide/nickel transport system substrate-binding protein
MLAAPAVAESTLRVVVDSDLEVLDPIWTTGDISRNHGYVIYDVLFATDAKGEIQPQMVDKYETSPDKLTWTFTLRQGLEWHDRGELSLPKILSRRSRLGGAA